MRIKPLVQTLRTYLLLSFNHKFHVARQGVGTNHQLKSLSMHESLPLVVVCAATPDFTILDDGFKRVRIPFVNGIYGHHIVVSIDQYGREVRVYNFLSVYNGVAIRGHYFGFIATRF